MACKTFLPLFLFVPCFLLSHSYGDDKIYQLDCPDSFDCGALGKIRFPFSNDTYPSCGLYAVNCSGRVPSIDLGSGQAYEVEEILNDQAVKVRDKWLGDFISNRSCDLFGYWVDLNTVSVTFTVSPNFTVFKCINTSHELNLQTDEYFRGNQSYKNCSAYSLYFKYPSNPVPTTNLPQNCVEIQLPAVESVGNGNSSDLFSVMASEYTFELQVSKECLDCHLKGGQCPMRNTSNIQCINQRKVPGRSNLGLILGIAASAVAGIGISVSLYLCMVRKWQSKTEDHRKVEAFLKNYGTHFPKRYSFNEIKKMTNSFRMKLGQGGYGCVFKGKLENGCLVAVKVLEESKGTGEEFINEVAAISRTSHINIVTLLGFCFEGRIKALVYEYMSNGSLEKFIHDCRSSSCHQLGWNTLHKIAIGIARGLEYLHRGCNMRILHFDIKPHNILLDEDFSPKISDFGLAKLCPQKESTISLLNARGTAGYIAPELFSRNFGNISHKSDVYSYGMMILEMVGGRNNICLEADHSSEIYFPHWIYKRIMHDKEIGLHGIQDVEEDKSARKMIIVGLWCIQANPSHRPSVSRVVEMLEGSLESLQIPPTPFLSSSSGSPVDSSETLGPLASDADILLSVAPSFSS